MFSFFVVLFTAEQCSVNTLTANEHVNEHAIASKSFGKAFVLRLLSKASNWSSLMPNGTHSQETLRQSNGVPKESLRGSHKKTS